MLGSWVQPQRPTEPFVCRAWPFQRLAIRSTPCSEPIGQRSRSARQLQCKPRAGLPLELSRNQSQVRGEGPDPPRTRRGWHRPYPSWHRPYSSWHRPYPSLHRPYPSWHRRYPVWHRAFLSGGEKIGTCQRGHTPSPGRTTTEAGGANAGS